MYYAVMAFGRNDVGPRSNLELVFICLTMIISAFFNAYIFGTISGLYTEIRKKTVKFNDNIDTANTSLSNLKIPNKLSIEVRKYITNTYTP